MVQVCVLQRTVSIQAHRLVSPSRQYCLDRRGPFCRKGHGQFRAAITDRTRRNDDAALHL